MSNGFLIALALSLLLPGCAKLAPAVTAPPEAADIPDSTVAAGKELFCLASSQEEAEKLAALYGIELTEFSYGVATFHTEEDPQAVIARGEKNGWTPLSLNIVEQLVEPESLGRDDVG